jgi:hypothetical protein
MNCVQGLGENPQRHPIQSSISEIYTYGAIRRASARRLVVTESPYEERCASRPLRGLPGRTGARRCSGVHRRGTWARCVCCVRRIGDSATPADRVPSRLFPTRAIFRRLTTSSGARPEFRCLPRLRPEGLRCTHCRPFLREPHRGTGKSHRGRRISDCAGVAMGSSRDTGAVRRERECDACGTSGASLCP